MTITVTQEDIDKGIRNSCENCPIALALKRAYPGRGRVHVELDHAYVDDEDYPLLDYAEEFVDDFDNGRTVQPFTFELA